jgi:peptidoglycan hydrolase-like protein with peptidoglycan-binding domain
VGIVEFVTQDETGAYFVHTIEGNNHILGPTPTEVRRYVYALDDPSIRGYGVRESGIVGTELKMGSSGEAVVAFQKNLIELGFYDDEPAGKFGKGTETATKKYQKARGLSATGVADQNTWDTIVEEYEPALVRVGPAQPLEIILEPGQIIRRGDEEPNVYILQAVLIVLSQMYASITPPGMNGRLDEATAASLEAFQALSGLPQTGELDKVTWKQLALHYPLAANKTMHQSFDQEF